MDVQSSEFRDAQALIWGQAYSFTGCASIICAIQLGILDAMDNHGKAMTLSELTDALPINPSKAPYMNRLMRSLVNAGFISEEQLGDGKEGRTNVYALTPASRLLLKNEPLNLRGIVIHALDPDHLKAWNALSDWFQNDVRTAAETALGKNYWDCITKYPKMSKLFTDTMAADSKLVAKCLITEHKFLFEGMASMVEVGGAGALARAIAESFPSLRCTVLDLPETVANLEPKENLDFVAGDMFEKIPPANAIFLKTLHDCNDEDCVKILKNCKKAIPRKEKGGKVILIDNVLQSKIHDNESIKIQISMDIDALVLLGNKERTEEEWSALFQEAGFSGYKIFPMMDFRSLIVVYP